MRNFSATRGNSGLSSFKARFREALLPLFVRFSPTTPSSFSYSWQIDPPPLQLLLYHFPATQHFGVICQRKHPASKNEAAQFFPKRGLLLDSVGNSLTIAEKAQLV